MIWDFIPVRGGTVLGCSHERGTTRSCCKWISHIVRDIKGTWFSLAKIVNAKRSLDLLPHPNISEDLDNSSLTSTLPLNPSSDNKRVIFQVPLKERTLVRHLFQLLRIWYNSVGISCSIWYWYRPCGCGIW